MSFNIAIDADQKLHAVCVSSCTAISSIPPPPPPAPADRLARQPGSSLGVQDAEEHGLGRTDAASPPWDWRERERAKEREVQAALREQGARRTRVLHAKLNLKSPRMRVEGGHSEAGGQDVWRGTGKELVGHGPGLEWNVRSNPYFEPVAVPKLRLPLHTSKRRPCHLIPWGGDGGGAVRGQGQGRAEALLQQKARVTAQGRGTGSVTERGGCSNGEREGGIESTTCREARPLVGDWEQFAGSREESGEEDLVRAQLQEVHSMLRSSFAPTRTK